MLRMNLKGLFQEFNPSKFLVYLSLFLCSLILGLKLDGFVMWSYWVVFTPLWVWKVIVFTGAVSGTALWLKHPEYRRDGNVDLQAMLVAATFHLLLLIFEVLLCMNLEGLGMPYRLVFIPLYFISASSIGACVWGFRHDRSLELETFFAVNILEFICISLKLDHVIGWSWVVVFVPVWIIITLLCVIVLYYVIWAALFIRSPDITPTQRKGHAVYAVMSCFMVIPLLAFLVTLSRHLDGLTHELYSTVMIPLQISLLSLIVTSFYQKGGNPWWFGMRKDFCEFVLDVCPCLREYGNISYNFKDTIVPVTDEPDPTPSGHSKQRPLNIESQAWLSKPTPSIETPD